MKHATYIIIILLLFAPQAMAQETSADFGTGSSIIGADNRACSGVLEGSIRYMAGTGTCGAGESYYKGSCYEKFTTTVNWATAEANCVTWGGHLVTLNNAAEDNWVYTNLSINLTQTWIGLNDQTTEDTFVWSSGEANTYTNWDWNTPDNDNGNQDCAGYYNADPTTWQDSKCSHLKQYLCEKPGGASACLEVCDGTNWVCPGE